MAFEPAEPSFRARRRQHLLEQPKVKWIEVIDAGDGHPRVRKVLVRGNIRDVNHLKSELTDILRPGLGAVRHIYTPAHGTVVTSLDQVQPNHKYLTGTGNKTFKKLSDSAGRLLLPDVRHRRRPRRLKPLVQAPPSRISLMQRQAMFAQGPLGRVAQGGGGTDDRADDAVRGGLGGPPRSMQGLGARQRRPTRPRPSELGRMDEQDEFEKEPTRRRPTAFPALNLRTRPSSSGSAGKTSSPSSSPRPSGTDSYRYEEESGEGEELMTSGGRPVSGPQGSSRVVSGRGSSPTPTVRTRDSPSLIDEPDEGQQFDRSVAGRVTSGVSKSRREASPSSPRGSRRDLDQEVQERHSDFVCDDSDDEEGRHPSPVPDAVSDESPTRGQQPPKGLETSQEAPGATSLSLSSSSSSGSDPGNRKSPFRPRGQPTRISK